jgi:hypothetical protein
MGTYQTPYQKALSDEALRAGDKAFFATQHQHELHQLLLDTFLETGMKRADLARRSGHSPAVITRVLSEPRNYQASTVAVLMATMGYEIGIERRKIVGSQRRQNYVPPLQRLLEKGKDTQKDIDLKIEVAPPSPTARTAVLELAKAA